MATLVQYTQATVTRLTVLESDAHDDLAAATSALVAARSSYDDALKARADAEQAVADAREALGQVEVAPAASGGGQALRTALIELREASRDWLGAKLALASAEDWVANANAMISALGQALSEAKVELAEATTRKADYDGWAAVVSADAGTIAGIAATSKGPIAKVQDSLPAALRDRAVARMKAAQADDAAHRAHLAALQDIQDGVASSGNPVLWRALERADDALAEFASLGAARLREAQALLTRIAARPTIDPDVLASLTADGDGSRSAAAGFEAAVTTAKASLRDANDALDEGIAKVLAKDPDDVLADTAIVEGTTTLGDLRTAVSQAEGDLTSAEGDNDQAQQDIMAAWQADVPASVWADLYDDVRAQALFAALEVHTTPQDLVDAVDAAEAALVAALEADEDRERSFDLIANTIDECEGDLARDAALAETLHRAALEGWR